MPLQWGKVIVGKAEKYNGLLGQVYLCRLLKFTKIEGEKSSYMIIVLMKSSPLARDPLSVVPLALNLPLKHALWGMFKPSAMQVVVDFCSQNSLDSNIVEPDTSLCGKVKFLSGRFGINCYLASFFIYSFKNHHCQRVLDMFLNSSF